jgi:hypothetical protein
MSIKWPDFPKLFVLTLTGLILKLISSASLELAFSITWIYSHVSSEIDRHPLVTEISMSIRTELLLLGEDELYT